MRQQRRDQPNILADIIFADRPPAGVAALADEARNMTRPTPYEEDPMLDSILQKARQPGTDLRAKRSEIGLYSQLEQVTLDMPGEKLTPQDALNYLSKNVKDVEMKWSDTEDWLKWLKETGRTSVTKQEILEHVRANDIEVIETRYDAPTVSEVSIQTNQLKKALSEIEKLDTSLWPRGSETDKFVNEVTLLREKIAENERLMSDMERYPERYRTPKASSTLPGGTNARDILLGIPKWGGGLSEVEEARWQLLKSKRHYRTITPVEQSEFDKLDEKSRAAKRVSYRDRHYKRRNTVGWLRLKDVSGQNLFTGVETPDLKDRTYIQMDPGITVSELTGDLQSDWAQEGGQATELDYGGDEPSGVSGFMLPDIIVEGGNKAYWVGREDAISQEARESLKSQGITERLHGKSSGPFTHGYWAKLAAEQKKHPEWETVQRNKTEIIRQEEARPLKESSLAVPDMPFRREEHWTGLMLKHWLREAAIPPKGQEYDMLTWTPGEIQVARMGTGRRYAEGIHFYENPKTGRAELFVYGKRGELLEETKWATRENLHKYLGKEVTERLLAQKPRTTPVDFKSVYTLDAETDSGAVDMNPGREEIELGGETYGGTKQLGIPFGKHQKNLRFYDETIANTFRQILKPLIGKKAAKEAIGYVWRKVDTRTINKLAKDPIALQSGVVDVERGLIKMHSLKLTPEMLKKVRAGLTKFAGGGLVSMAPEARDMFRKPRSMTKATFAVEPRLTDLGPGAIPGVAGLCGVARNMNRSVVA